MSTGAIIAIVAFLPLVILIFLNKDMDKGQKATAGIVGVESRHADRLRASLAAGVFGTRRYGSGRAFDLARPVLTLRLTDGRSTLLVFVSPSCPVCKALLPVLKASVRSERNWGIGDFTDLGQLMEWVGRLGGSDVGTLPLLAGAGATPRALQWPLRLAGIVTAATGFTGWCPVYHAAGVTSLGGPGDRPDEAERREWVVPRVQVAGDPPSAEENES